MPTAVEITDRLLTGDALALADVELPILAGATGVGVVEEPFVGAGHFPVVPLMFFVASLTS